MMAKRPAWTIENNRVICKEFEFEWNGGFFIKKKKKNIKNLHNSIIKETNESVLEVSSKGLTQLGKDIGAFSLKYNEVPLENVFQSSKKFENGGPYTDLMSVTPKEAKGDERLKNSGKILTFCLGGEEWPLEPKTLFYDYIYIKALIQNYGYDLDLTEYDWFTDIEFNPKKSINCQARTVAIYKLLKMSNKFDVIENKEKWTEFHKEYIKG